MSEALTTTGVATAATLFTPYGAVRYSSGTMPTSKGFTGQRADATIGLDYYHARYDDAQLGQFTSADSAKQGGLNRYGYVLGNPETYTDPSGHMQCATCGGGGGGGGGDPPPPPPPSGNGGPGNGGPGNGGPCITDNNCPTDPPSGGTPPSGGGGSSSGCGGCKSQTLPINQSYCSKECQQYAECKGDGRCAAQQIAQDVIPVLAIIGVFSGILATWFKNLATATATAAVGDPSLLPLAYAYAYAYAYASLAIAFVIISAASVVLVALFGREGAHSLDWYTETNISNFYSSLGKVMATVLVATQGIGDYMLILASPAAGVGVRFGGLAVALGLGGLIFANLNDQEAAIYDPNTSSNLPNSPGQVVA